jgi:hypothetical protein
MKHIGLHCTKARNSRKGGGAHLDVRARRASGTRGTLAFARFSSLRATHATSLDHASATSRTQHAHPAAVPAPADLASAPPTASSSIVPLLTVHAGNHTPCALPTPTAAS